MSTANAESTTKPLSLPKPGLNAGTFGTLLFLLIAVPCFITLPYTIMPPLGEASGNRYNDLRYDTEVEIDGQLQKIETQEQGPGMVSFVRERTDKATGETVPVVKTLLEPMGTDDKGRSLFVRCLLGGSISLGVGICAALMAVFIGVTWGAMAGYMGGRVDSVMMRIVDVLYGLPYLLLVVLLSVAVGGVVDACADGFLSIPAWVQWLWGVSPFVYILATLVGFVALAALTGAVFHYAGLLARSSAGFLDIFGFIVRLITFFVGAGSVFMFLWMVVIGVLLPTLTPEGMVIVPGWIVSLLTEYSMIINLITLIVAIGGVSWLTMARVIRGQVLSLRTEPFIEAARAMGMGPARILRVHLLPNLIGPIVVYTTLAVPQAILQESFLSFLGIGVTPPQPSWGQLASEGIKELPALALPALSDQFKWWVLVFPCLLLGLTLLSLNFMGDAMREKFDPRSKKRGV